MVLVCLLFSSDQKQFYAFGQHEIDLFIIFVKLSLKYEEINSLNVLPAYLIIATP